MELALKKNELEKAGKLAMIFGLNGQHLLEYAGDMFLSNKEFSRAVTSYKLSKVDKLIISNISVMISDPVKYNIGNPIIFLSHKRYKS